MPELDTIAKHVVVDGSNLATEGRSLPSFAQLQTALADFRAEFPKVKLTIVVDATFEHRINASEAKAYEAAETSGEILTPPAGAIGRGDVFVLRIADKIDATVLSNDSFQEFHGEYEWLFNEGRLIGGKPVPGVGWIFTLRTPVRGPKSRVAVATAKKKARRKEATEQGFDSLEQEVAARRARGKSAPATTKATKAPAQKATATKAAKSVATDATDDKTDASRRRRRRRSGGVPSQPVNTAGTFLEFVSKHRVKSKVVGLVDNFSSHGAYITVDGARCYIPLVNLASPAPRSARDAIKRDQEVTLEVVGFQAARRSIELSMPGALADAARARLAAVAKAEETESKAPAKKAAAAKTVATKAPAKKAAAKKVAKEPAKKVAKTVAKKAAPKKAAAKVVKKVAAKKAATKSVAKTAVKKAAPKKAAKTTAKKAVGKASTVKVTKRAAAKKPASRIR